MVLELELSIVVHSDEPQVERHATLKQLYQVQDYSAARLDRTEWELVHFILESIFYSNGEKRRELAELFINSLYEATAH